MSAPVVFIKDPGIEWDQAATLEETVIGMFKRKETGTPEFQALIAFYGRPKLVAIWEKYKATSQVTDGTGASNE